MVDRATSDLILNEDVIEEWGNIYNHPLLLNSSAGKQVASWYDIWKVDHAQDLLNLNHHFKEFIWEDWHSVVSLNKTYS